MRKLHKLKNFFTLDETVRYLSDSLEEAVTLSDIYRLVIDNHLALSVRLINQAFAIKGQIVTGEDGDLVQLQTDLVTGEVLDEPSSVYINDDAVPVDVNKWFLSDRKIHVIDGIWDLVMIGMGSLEIERLYQNEINGVYPVVADGVGLYLKQGEILCRLQNEPIDKKADILADIQSGLISILEPKGISVDDFLARDSDNLYDDLTAEEVDEISFLFSRMNFQSDDFGDYEDSFDISKHGFQFVFKAIELTRFLQSLQDEPSVPSKVEQPISVKERKTLLKMIGALLKEQKIDPSKKGTASAIKLMTDIAGTPITENTIRKILGQVSDITA